MMISVPENPPSGGEDGVSSNITFSNEDAGLPPSLADALKMKKLPKMSPLASVERAVSDRSTSVTSGGSTFLSRASHTDDQEAMWESLRGKLLGREEQQKLLNECYERILLGKTTTFIATEINNTAEDATATTETPPETQLELVLITGAGGTGKSSLARSLIPRTSNDGCAFLSTKCQQVERPEPFAPFVRAFTRYFHRTLKRGGRDAKQHVLNAVERCTQDSDKGVLFNMIPALRGFYGLEEQDHHTLVGDVQIPTLFQAAAIPSNQNSTNNGHLWGRSNVETPTIALFCRFLKELCGAAVSDDEAGHQKKTTTTNIVLLVDDWQWMDTASLKLLEAIALQRNLKGFMLIGTCRGNELNAQADLSVTLRSIEARGVTVTDIAVGPLTINDVTRCASSLLDMEDMEEDPTRTAELAWLANYTHKQTEGNPFLVMELFRTLVDHQLLLQEEGSWVWNQRERLLSDLSLGSLGMVDATVRQLAIQSPSIRSFLQIACLLGSEFHISQVQRVGEMTIAESRLALSTLYKRGILNRTEDQSRHRSIFCHDRWQNAALALIPVAEQDDHRLWVGGQLLVHLSVDEIMEHAFLVAQLLFPKASTIEEQEDRNSVAEIFGLAGTKASRCSAFDVAASYFSKAISLLPENRWDPATYPLCLQLYNFSAEIECSLGHVDQVDSLVSEILLNAANLQDQLSAYETKIHSFSARNEHQESVKLGFHILELLDDPMPRRLAGLGDIRALLSVLRIVRNVKEENVLKLRPMTNWKKLAAIKILHFVGPSVIMSKPEKMLDLILKGVNLTLKHGLSPFSSIQFASLGMILCNPLGMIDEGFRLENIGYKIYEKLAAKELTCRVYLLRYAHNLPWREPIKVVIPKILEGARAGMLSGDVEMAGMNYAHAIVDKLLGGFPLNDVYQETTNLHAQFLELGQASINFYFQSSIQLMRNLMGLADNPLILSGDDFDAIQSIQEASAKNYSACESWLLLSQQFLALLLGDFVHAVELTRTLATRDTTAFCGLLCQYVQFLRALSEAIMARQAKGTRGNRSRANKALNRLKKFTGYPRPERGWSNKVLMVEAELYALKGQREVATFKWLSSIKDSERQNLVHEQALAHERLADSLQEWGDEKDALGHFREARSLYQTWGCIIKSNQMRRIIGEQTTSRYFAKTPTDEFDVSVRSALAQATN
jgi:predicted ATPase